VLELVQGVVVFALGWTLVSVAVAGMWVLVRVSGRQARLQQEVAWDPQRAEAPRSARPRRVAKEGLAAALPSAPPPVSGRAGADAHRRA
jgi:hypothetical protein